MRDHGGNLDMAMARYGGARGDWLDLSTGINPVAYPMPEVPQAAWAALPTRSDMDALAATARAAYGTAAAVTPLAGAQGLIQIVPHLRPVGEARILSPTYNEHAAAFRAAGWRVRDCPTPEALAGADAAVIVNPNNPDGRRLPPEALLALVPEVGMLLVDESFADPEPGLSVASAVTAQSEGLIVARSFGKFYGLAGVRLGFALSGAETARRIAEAAGPWPVAGPAIVAGRAALADTSWQEATRARLGADAARLDALAEAAGWRLVGGTPLFRTYDVGDGAAVQDRLARARVWSRAFPYAPGWLRLGLPAPGGWPMLSAALA